MNEKELASCLRRIANRIGLNNQYHVVRAINDEANYIDKPEPREWWLNVSSQGHPHYGYDDEATARHGLEMTCKTVRVREVLP